MQEALLWWIVCLATIVLCTGGGKANALVGNRPQLLHPVAGGISRATKHRTSRSVLLVEDTPGGLLLHGLSGDAARLLVKASNQSVEVLSLGREEVSERGTSVRAFHAIFGVYHLSGGSYLALVTKSRQEADLQALGDIHTVEEIEFVRIPDREARESDCEETQALHRRELRLLQQEFKRHSFLYSRQGLDIVRSVQRNNCGSQASDLGDYHFHWNRDVSFPFRDIPGMETITPRFVNALTSSVRFQHHGKPFLLALISRRSCRHQGPRFIKRGSNGVGDVANFVETEQVLIDEDRQQVLSSFVQVRGSIPLRWSQPDAWKAKPGIVVDLADTATAVEAQLDAMQKHLIRLSAMYNLQGMQSIPKLIVVNLTDKKGGQGALSRLWYELLLFLHRRTLIRSGVPRTIPQVSDFSDRNRTVVQDFSLASPAQSLSLSLRFVWMDYHYWVKKRGADSALAAVQASLLDPLNAFRPFFDAQQPEKDQELLVRTNCVDCLDRTNVFQSALSKWILERQLQAATGEPTENLGSDLVRELRTLWAGLGDELSLVYAGSRAMKRDVTINGVRTKRGVLDDTVAFFRRYYSSNYIDQQRQVSLDRLLGHGLHRAFSLVASECDGVEKTPIHEDKDSIQVTRSLNEEKRSYSSHLEDFFASALHELQDLA